MTRSDGWRRSNPSFEQIAEAVEAIQRRKLAAVMLEAGPTFFVRCDGVTPGGLTIRWFEGTSKRGTISTAEDVAPHVVVDALCRYALGDTTWDEQLTWTTRAWEQDIGQPTAPAVVPKEPWFRYSRGNLQIGRPVVRWVMRIAGYSLLGLSIFALTPFSGIGGMRGPGFGIVLGALLIWRSHRTKVEKRGYDF